MRNARNLILVGPMGSGKSAIGRLLAARLARGFVDVDARIEAQCGMTIPDIFTTEGEAGFRIRESRALADALAHEGQVVATGGGAVLDAGNRAAMTAAGTVIYLQVEPREQLLRVAGDTPRPLLDVADRGQRLACLQVQREPLYRQIAELVFDTSGQTPHGAADALAALLAPGEPTP